MIPALLNHVLQRGAYTSSCAVPVDSGFLIATALWSSPPSSMEQSQPMTSFAVELHKSKQDMN